MATNNFIQGFPEHQLISRDFERFIIKKLVQFCEWEQVLEVTALFATRDPRRLCPQQALSSLQPPNSSRRHCLLPGHQKDVVLCLLFSFR